MKNKQIHICYYNIDYLKRQGFKINNGALCHTIKKREQAAKLFLVRERILLYLLLKFLPWAINSRNVTFFLGLSKTKLS
jgi:hypothetical protein